MVTIPIEQVLTKVYSLHDEVSRDFKQKWIYYCKNGCRLPCFDSEFRPDMYRAFIVNGHSNKLFMCERLQKYTNHSYKIIHTLLISRGHTPLSHLFIINAFFLKLKILFPSPYIPCVQGRSVNFARPVLCHEALYGAIWFTLGCQLVH